MKGIILYSLAFLMVVSHSLMAQAVPDQQAATLLAGQHQEQGVDRFGLTRPPGPFTGITLSGNQATQIRLLDRQFGEFFVAQNNRTRQAGGDVRAAANKSAIQSAHVQLMANIRTILTPAQQLIFDRNQSARDAYVAQRRAFANKK